MASCRNFRLGAEGVAHAQGMEDRSPRLGEALVSDVGIVGVIDTLFLDQSLSAVRWGGG